MLAAEEAKDGPPKGYMAEQAVEARRVRRLSQCSHRARIDTGTFKDGSLSERVRNSAVTTKYMRESCPSMMMNSANQTSR